MGKKFNFDFLSEEDIKKIHSTSLKILKEIGIKVPHKTILDVFRRNGASVDFETEIVKINEDLVEKMLKKALENQKKYYSKKENKDEGIRGWMIFNKSGDYIDYKDYKKKKASIRDIINAILIGNSLEYTKRISHFVEPKKYREFNDVICYYLLFVYSKKRNFLGYIGSAESARCIIEMAKVIEEDAMVLKSGRLLEYELLPVNNLEYSKEALDITLEFVKNNLKILVGHWCWMGYHTPLAYASALTLSNANLLAGISIIMMLNPKQLYLDYIMDIFTANRHYKNAPLFGSPNQAIFAIAAKQIADYYGFEVIRANVGLTDAIENNFQSGFERGVSAALTIACGADIIGLEGLNGANQGISFDQLVIDNELLSYLNFIFNKKITVNKETLNFEKIWKKGIGANFQEDLEDKESLQKAYWESEIFNYKNYDNFIVNESYKKISARINEILKNNYPPEPAISKEKIEKLDKLIESYIKNKDILLAFKEELRSCFQ